MFQREAILSPSSKTYYLYYFYLQSSLIFSANVSFDRLKIKSKIKNKTKSKIWLENKLKLQAFRLNPRSKTLTKLITTQRDAQDVCREKPCWSKSCWVKDIQVTGQPAIGQEFTSSSDLSMEHSSLRLISPIVRKSKCNSPMLISTPCLSFLLKPMEAFLYQWPFDRTGKELP